MTAKPLDDRTVGALFWQVSGPVARATVQGDFTVGSASQFRDVALAPAGPLPALFEVGLGCQGDDYEYEVVVNTAGLPKENPSDGKFWQQPVGDTGYVARSAQEITDAECRSDR
ncbi:hypothetical protein ACIQBJ_14700 [Kitasatospora sp. NPDC088391]|uniref:hypothetical protein n=1 Tax=Kitasatospora sp. NPDC088391 TaxID=3364074 RepID=UPI00380708DB